MLKLFLFFSISLFLIGEAKCQSTDTVFMYFKYSTNQPKQVGTLDSADFIRIIYPPDSSDHLYNIKEFYKNGKIKFIGKSDTHVSDVYFLSGDCISFYPNGKKENISYYNSYGKKDGLEYFFRPDGHICFVIKWIEQTVGFIYIKLYWECYDDEGNIIAEKGNGKWLIHDADFKNIILSGQVKNGYMEGEWHGFTMRDDSIKYICKYKRGAFISATGYDKTGASYPFVTEKQVANYKGGSMFAFLRDLRRYLKLPRDISGKKMNVDTVHISFVIEKDGHLTQLETLGNIDPDLKDALNLAVIKCDDWIPSKYFGVPFRTRIVLPLKVQEGYNKMNFYEKSIEIRGQVLDFSKDESDLIHQN